MEQNTSKIPTLGEFIIDTQSEHDFTTGELSQLLSCIRIATKIVNREVNKAGIANIIGKHGEINVQGEVQQKLDVFANETFIKALVSREVVCGIASEELEDYLCVKSKNLSSKTNKYCVLIDPLDGSSNIDVNVSVGTIFSILRRKTELSKTVQLEDFLQPGYQQVAAGYVVYGSSTMIVYTTGNGVNGFTLDPSIGTFYLSHPNIQIPKSGNIYSVNEGKYLKFPLGVKNYIKYCQEEQDDRPYTSRYIGSLVSDIHRNMLKGGIYLYPSFSNAPYGKLRLLYECNPIAMLIEQAGGKASDGFGRIMDIIPTELHQRSPFFCGSKDMVEKLESLMSEFSKNEDR